MALRRQLELPPRSAAGPGRGTRRAGPPRSAPFGPFDADDLGPDLDEAVGSVDFGAVRVPVPDRGTLSVEPAAGGRMQAVHISLPQGRLSVSALAAPKSSRLWPELAKEIHASLRDGGARVRSFQGDWGRELHATTDSSTSVFVGVDGPRWMVYGVATGPTAAAAELDAELRRMLRGTVVVRGRSPYPVRTVLPLEVPADLVSDQASDRTTAAVGPAAGPPVSPPAVAALPETPASRSVPRRRAGTRASGDQGDVGEPPLWADPVQRIADAVDPDVDLDLDPEARSAPEEPGAPARLGTPGRRRLREPSALPEPATEPLPATTRPGRGRHAAPDPARSRRDATRGSPGVDSPAASRRVRMLGPDAEHAAPTEPIPTVTTRPRTGRHRLPD